MKVDGSIANIMICLFMISILHKSFAYEEYELNAKNNKITIDLNVNINTNGSKTKEKPSGNLFFTILYINDVVLYTTWNRGIIFTLSISYTFRNRKFLDLI